MRETVDDKKIIELYKSGVGAKEICSSLGIGKTTVFRVLKRNGTEVSGCRREVDIKIVEDLYRSGKSIKEISSIIGETKRVIGRRMKEFGIEARGRKECQKSADSDKIIYMYKNGFSRKEIMQEVGCANSVITRYLKENEINPGRLKPKVDVSRIINVYLETGSVTDTARVLSLSAGVVSKHLKNAEVAVSKNKVSGELHWNWKGGITPRIDALRHSDEFKRWRKSVYKRDKYNCMMPGCSRHGGEIHAHHIVPIYEDESKIFDTSNGITLCRECHEKTYSKEKEFIPVFQAIIKD